MIEPKEGNYYLVFNSSDFASIVTGEFFKVKCIECCGRLQFQIHDTRLILEKNEIEEFIEEITKPRFGTEY